MKKIHLIGLALVALLAFASLSASSAFALEWEPAEWLVGGKPAQAGQNAKLEGELLLEDKKLGIAVICSGILDGEYQTPTDLLIRKVLSLAGVEIEVLKGAGLLCKTEKGCAENVDLEVWPENLPWLLFPELDVSDSKPWVLVFGEGAGAPGYTVKCLVLGISTEETCLAIEGSGNEVIDATGGVETAAGTEDNENGTCTVGGEGAGVIEAETADLLTSEEGLTSISTP